MPVVGVVYGTTKKVFSGIGGPGSGNAFKRFVLARLPGRTTPGFLTGTFTLKRSDGSEHEVCTVYVPTNHLYVGDVVVLPVTDVIETDLSVEDGVSLMLSAGASVPRVVSRAVGGRGDPGGGTMPDETRRAIVRARDGRRVRGTRAAGGTGLRRDAGRGRVPWRGRSGRSSSRASSICR